jgi:hypothetical protein
MVDNNLIMFYDKLGTQKNKSLPITINETGNAFTIIRWLQDAETHTINPTCLMLNFVVFQKWMPEA